MAAGELLLVCVMNEKILEEFIDDYSNIGVLLSVLAYWIYSQLVYLQ